jgi:hypothetical protein
VSPSSCLPISAAGNAFTSTTLANPVPVSAGQIIQASVVISFTSN